MFYLMMHSTHCNWGERGKEVFNLMTHSNTLQLGKERKGSVLFNDALNTFYLRLYGIRHMVKRNWGKKGKEVFYLMMHSTHCNWGKEGKEVFYLMTHSTHCNWGKKGKDTFYLMMLHSTHFIYSYMGVEWGKKEIHLL